MLQRRCPLAGAPHLRVQRQRASPAGRAARGLRQAAGSAPRRGDVETWRRHTPAPPLQRCGRAGCQSRALALSRASASPPRADERDRVRRRCTAPAPPCAVSAADRPAPPPLRVAAASRPAPPKPRDRERTGPSARCAASQGSRLSSAIASEPPKPPSLRPAPAAARRFNTAGKAAPPGCRLSARGRQRMACVQGRRAVGD